MNRYDEQDIPPHVLDEFYTLVSTLRGEEKAVQLLLAERMGWPVGAQPAWNGRNAVQAWADIRRQIDNGALHTGAGHSGVYHAVVQDFPFNRQLLAWREYFEKAQPTASQFQSSNQNPNQSALQNQSPNPNPNQNLNLYGAPPAYQDPPQSPPISSAPQAAPGLQPGAQPDSRGSRAQPPPQPQPQLESEQPRPYVIVRGTSEYDKALALVRLLDPHAEMRLAVQSHLVAGLDPARQVSEEALRTQLRSFFGETVVVEIRWLTTPPHIFTTIVGIGPDEREFRLDNVPSTARFADVAEAVMGMYRNEGPRAAQDNPSVTHVRRGLFRRPVNNTSAELGDAGVDDGDEVVVHPQSTAGAAGPAGTIWTEAVMRVRAEVLAYAKGSGGRFSVRSMDNPNFPTRYRLEITESGFAPPPEPGAPPEPIDTHHVELWLDRTFPMTAPRVAWTTPFFHPNVVSLDSTKYPPGAVCLGPLADAYRPDLDIGEVCQMLRDIAAYRNYELLTPNQGGQGFINPDAADWAASARGQDAIAARGGMRWSDDLGDLSLPDPREPPAPSVAPLAVAEVPDFPDGIPGDDDDDW